MAKETKSKGSSERAARVRSEIPKQVDIHYIKTGGYRTYYMDGIFGGLTPTGKIYVELFLQRPPTPQIIQQEVKVNGELGEELRRVGKTGMVREIEAGIVMDIQVAKIFKEWLEEKIRVFEEQTALLPKNGGEDAV